MEQVQTTYLITDFSNLSSHKWRIVNDGVMGGLSRSHLQMHGDGHAAFQGELSLKNNGGFASVMNVSPLNLEGYSSIQIKVRGDGKRYSFRFRTGSDFVFHHWVYEARFDTRSGEWKIVKLPLHRFNATYHGEALADAPMPDLSSIREYGFLISDRQPGKFRLEIEWIKAVD